MDNYCLKNARITFIVGAIWKIMSRKVGLVDELRWHNHLDPQINKRPWLENEEKTIF